MAGRSNLLTRREVLLGASAIALGCGRETEPGFRPLFNGRTLEGWRAIPRVPVAAWPGAPEPSKESLSTAQSGLTSMSNSKSPKVSSGGIMLRATALGGQGFQVHLDYRLLGSVATFFGNGIGNWRARHYAFNPKLDAGRRVVGLIREPAPDEEIKKLAWHSAPEAFFSAWKFGDWNNLRVRLEGEYPRITTWVNGVQIAVLDAATLEAPNYDWEAVAKLLGRRGHIALEVHDSGDDLWMGQDRWLPGHVCRWRNIKIKPL